MTCEECREKWSAILDKEVSLPEIRAVLAHLQICSECCRYCCELTCLDALLRSLDAPLSSERLWERIKAMLMVVSPQERPIPEGWVVVRSHLSRLGRA